MRRTVFSTIAAVSVGVFTALNFTQEAASQEICDCIVGEAGTLDSAAGVVQMSGANGLGPAQQGAVLGSGSQVVVGAGSATVNFGQECDVALLGVNTELTVSPLDNGQLCVRVTSDNGVVVGEVTPDLNPLSVLLAGGAIAGIIWAIDEASGGDDSASD